MIDKKFSIHLLLSYRIFVSYKKKSISWLTTILIFIYFYRQKKINICSFLIAQNVWKRSKVSWKWQAWTCASPTQPQHWRKSLSKSAIRTRVSGMLHSISWFWCTSEKARSFTSTLARWGFFLGFSGFILGTLFFQLFFLGILFSGFF